MIRPLRRRHLAAWALLAVLLPVGFAAGLLVRPAAPRVDALPEALATPAQDLPLAPLEIVGPDAHVELGVAVVPDGDGRALVARPASALLKPDVLVYWSPVPPDGGTLPEDAHLLGRLAGTHARRYPLPDRGDRPGHVILYSLGHQELLGSAELPSE